MVYKQDLIGKVINCNGQNIEIIDSSSFDKWIQFTENKLAGQKFNALKKQKNPDHKLPYEDIVKKYWTAEDVLRNMPSAYGVFDKQQRQNGEKPEVKIRETPLGLTNFEGYTDTEKDYITSRLLEYEKDYDIEKAADKFKAIRAIVCEMKILQLELLLTNKPKGDSDIQKQIDTLDKQHAFHCDGLNVLKKQRDNAKQKPKDQGTDLTSAINQLDKSINEMQLEVESDRKQEIEMIKKLSKKTKKDLEDL
jgi:hypothetical protein